MRGVFTMKTNSVTEKTFGREQIIRIVIAAIAIALTYVFTAFVNITLPIAINGGLIHLGNVPLFLFAILFGKKVGALAGGIGMGLFDLLSPWAIWAPFTLVIVGLMGFVVGLISEKKKGFGKKGEALFSRLKDIVKKGNVSKIQVKKDGELVLNVPVNAGLVGVVIAPIAAVVAVVAAFGFKCSIEIIKTDGTIIDVSDAVTDAMGSVAEKSSTVAGEVKERSTTWYQKGLEKAGEAVSKIKKAGEEVADAAEELYEESRLVGEDEDETDAPCEAADTAEGAGETAEEQEETAEKE